MKNKIKRLVPIGFSKFLFSKNVVNKTFSSIAILYHSGIGMGDTLMISSMVKYLEEYFTECIFFHVEDQYRLFKEHNYLTFWQFLKKIYQIDLIVIPEFSLRYLKYFPVLNLKKFVGYFTPEFISNFLEIDNSFKIDYRKQHWMERVIKITEFLTEDRVNLKNFFYKLPASEKLKNYQLPQNYIVFNPFSLIKQRGFSVAFFRKLLRKILDLSCPIILIGSPDFANESEEYCISKKVINLTGKTSKYEAVYIIKNAKAYLGLDSGLMHIAIAYKLPVLSFFKGVNPLLRKPFFYGENNVFYYYTSCSDCPVFPCYDPINGHLYKREFCEKHGKVNWKIIEEELSEFFERLNLK